MKKILLSLFGLALFLLIILSVGVDKILQSFSGLNPAMLPVVLALQFASLGVKGFKQQILVSVFKPGTKWIEHTKIWTIGFFFGTASPAKSGDSIRSLYLKRKFDLSLGQGLAVVFVERVLDIAFLFAFAFLGLYFVVIPKIADDGIMLSLGAFFALFVAALFVFTRKNILRKIARPFFNVFAPEKFKESLKEGFNDFYKSFSDFKSNAVPLLAIGFFTVISWLVVFAVFYAISVALSMNIDPIALVAVLPIILLVEALPISFSGLGTREAASVVMLGLIGVPAALAVSFSLTVLVFNLLLAAVGFAVFNSTEKPI